MPDGDGVLKERLREACKRRGAAAFGVASADEVDSLPKIKIGWIINRYTKKLGELMPDARSAVVFGIHSSDDWFELAVRGRNGGFSYPGYMPLSLIFDDVADILCNEGFKAAQAWDLASFKQIASLAGIGTYGKNALILTPKHGPWLRFGLVVTNAGLPPDRPFDEDLCGKCTRCIRACPAHALEPYAVDPEKCIVGAHILEQVPRWSKPLIASHEPQLTPRTHVMCRECQLACRYTTPERRRHVIAPSAPPRPRRKPGRA